MSMSQDDLNRAIEILTKLKFGGGGPSGIVQTQDIKSVTDMIAKLLNQNNAVISSHQKVIGDIYNKLPPAIETALQSFASDNSTATMAVELAFSDMPTLDKDGNINKDSKEVVWKLPIDMSRFREQLNGTNRSNGALTREIANVLVHILQGIGDQSTLQRKGVDESTARAIMLDLREARESIQNAETNNRELVELRANYKSLKETVEDKGQLHAAKRENELLKDQLEKMKRSNPECERYVEHIRHLNARVAALQQKEIQFNKLKDDHETLLARYEMLRVQYVRVRVQKCTPRLPELVAGFPHPINKDARVITDLYGAYVTDRESRRAAGEDVETSDDDDYVDQETRTRMQARKRRLAEMLNQGKETKEG